MAEYIDKQALGIGKCNPEIFDDKGYANGWNAAIDIIQSAPAADVRPVKRGRWIQTTQPMGWRDEDCAECSVCGEDFVLDEWAMEDFTNLMNYCPNCGADMREEDE